MSVTRVCRKRKSWREESSREESGGEASVEAGLRGVEALDGDCLHSVGSTSNQPVVVVDDQQRIRLDLEEARRGADRAPGLVHVRLRLQQPQPQLAEPYLGKRSREFRAPRAA